MSRPRAKNKLSEGSTRQNLKTFRLIMEMRQKIHAAKPEASLITYAVRSRESLPFNIGSLPCSQAACCSSGKALSVVDAEHSGDNRLSRELLAVYHDARGC